MRIAVTGTSGVGRDIFIKDFINTWSNYKKSEGLYKKLIVDKNLKLDRDGTQDSQYEILNSMIDEAMLYKKTDDIIHDRSVLDNIAHTFWLAAQEPPLVDDNFIQKSIHLVKQSLAFYDIIFYIPLLEKYPYKSNKTIDLDYQIQIDNFLKAIQDSYLQGKPWLFDFKSVSGCPALIELFGNDQERIQMVKLYITELGNTYDKKDSLIEL